MATGAPQNLKARKFLFALLLIVIAVAVIYTILQNRPWTVPEEAKQRKNPLTSSDAIRQSIRPLYNDKCASCHGNSGKGDGHDATLYDPAPTNFADAKRMSAVTDGELFFKLSEGRKPMPSFKKRLTEDQRWRLILLLRSFAEPPSDVPDAKSSAALGTSIPQP
ncbi:MAG: cytochrome c [Candidatus Acidiferrum sp.]|jgi:mono/diheme cytochrome c family protein